MLPPRLQAAPTEEEAVHKEAALAAIQDACRKALNNNRRMKVGRV